VPDHELLRCIGRGAYGEVWLSRNVFGAYRAVKVVYRASFDSDRPYQREFAGIQRVEPISRAHEGHVPILQAGRNDAAGYFYYVMELADDAGAEPDATHPDCASDRLNPELASRIESYVPRTLKEDLNRRGQLAFEECLRLGLALSSGLDYLHKHGLVHRDIKPSNIIYLNDAPKLTDIGLVTLADATCSVVGTEGYLPPEGPGSAQGDLFSLGKVLYETLTGMDRRNFPELPPQWPPLGEADRLLEINAIVLKACKRDPRERYQSASQLHADLLLLQAGKSVRRTRLLEQRLAGFYRIATGLTAVAVIASGAYFWTSFQMRRAERNLERAERSEEGLREQLRESLLHQARALRLSQLPGQRTGALEALSRAGAIRAGPDLLTEVVRCLGLMDARLVREWVANEPGPSDHMLDLRLDRVAQTDADGTITVRSGSTDLELARLPGSGVPCLLALFSPDGRYLAAKYHPVDREAFSRTLIWDLGSDAAPFLIPRAVTLRCIAFSPKSNRVAVATRDGEILIYDMASERLLLRCQGEPGPYALSFSPDGTVLATASLNGSVQLLSTTDARLLTQLAHPAAARGLAWHPDGVHLAVPCDDWLVHLWDVTTERRTAVFAGHKAQVVTARFSHDGKLLATVSWDKTMRLWEVDRAQALLSHPVTGGTRFVEFSPDSSLLAHFGDRIRAEVLELLQPAPIYEPTGIRGRPLPTADVDPQGQLIAFTAEQGVHLLHLHSPSNAAFWPVAGAASVKFLPDGRLVSAGDQGMFLTSVRAPSTSGTPPHVDPPSTLYSGRGTSDPNGLCIATQATRAILRNDADIAVVLDLDANATPLTRLPHQQIAFVAISSTGRWAATSGHADGDVKLWDADTGVLLMHWQGLGPARLLFEPQADSLLIASRDGCRIFESHTWSIVQHITPPARGRASASPPLSVSPQGDLLAIGWNPDDVQLVHLPRGTLLLDFHALGQIPLCFSPDGTALYVKGQYAELYRWNLQTLRQELAMLGLDW
jgi:WD40 repeat protein